MSMALHLSEQKGWNGSVLTRVVDVLHDGQRMAFPGVKGSRTARCSPVLILEVKTRGSESCLSGLAPPEYRC